MTYLNDGTITVSLYPMWETSRPDDLQLTRDRTIGGKDSYHNYALIRNFAILTRWVSTSDAQQINQWWLNSTPLTLYYGPEVSSFSTILTNEQHPYKKIEKGYQDQFYGVLMLTVK